MRPVAGRGRKIEGRIWLRIDDLGGRRYLDTPSNRRFQCVSPLTPWCPGNRVRYKRNNALSPEVERDIRALPTRRSAC